MQRGMTKEKSLKLEVCEAGRRDVQKPADIKDQPAGAITTSTACSRHSFPSITHPCRSILPTGNHDICCDRLPDLGEC